MIADELLVKTPFEERLFSMDFSDDLDTGETIETVPVPVITITPSGTLAASGIVVSVDGKAVQALFTGGTAGQTYDVACQVETSTQKRELCGPLEVIAC